MGLECGDGAGARLGVVDDRMGVVKRFAAKGWEFPWFVDDLVVEVGEFGDVGSDVVAGWVVSAALGDGIEDAEVGCGVGAGGCGPLPAAVVCGKIAIDEVAHEVAFAPLPIDEEVFGEEHGGDHAAAVVHPADAEELTHGGIDDGEAGAALTPGFEVRAVGAPGNVLGFEAESAGLAEARETDEQVLIELAPDQFVNPDIGAGAVIRTRIEAAASANGGFKSVARGEHTEGKVG